MDVVRSLHRVAAPGSGGSRPRRWERRRARKDADALILHGAVWRANPPIAWRVAELTAPRERKLLARSLRDIVRMVAGGQPAGPVPLDRAVIRPQLPKLGLLAARLVDLDRPVSPAGILHVRHLLTHHRSPLYTPSAPDALSYALRLCLDSLEVS